MNATKIICSLVLPALTAIAAIESTGQSLACTIDGTPSATVNGSIVVLNKVLPIGGNLQVWAPFLAQSSLRVGQNASLGEITQRVALTQEAFRNPWKWTFGDGSTSARGAVVHHVYRHPGIYKISVLAYFPSHKFWYTFDAIQVRVVKT
jgi:PKD domain